MSQFSQIVVSYGAAANDSINYYQKQVSGMTTIIPAGVRRNFFFANTIGTNNYGSNLNTSTGDLTFPTPSAATNSTFQGALYILNDYFSYLSVIGQTIVVYENANQTSADEIAFRLDIISQLIVQINNFINLYGDMGGQFGLVRQESIYKAT